MASQYTEGLQSVLAFMAESGFEFGRGVDGQSIILEALRRNNGNADQVVLDMVLQSVESFEKQYTAPLWDDKVFDANRDNTAPSTNSTTGLSYNIQGPDETNHEPIIYGTQPGMYDPSSFAAPTRPPSRATSPSVNIYPLTADAPRSVPPPPPLPQQSGITSFDIATPALPPRPEFGPANRESYDPNEWGMVATSGSGDSSGENDAQPMARLRSHGVPGFLRCREQHNDWLKHRMGALVMIYSSISAARNVLIRLPGRPLGLAPPDWWKYDRNNRPDSIGPIKDTQDWIVEIHQLMAFLLGDSERSYATADRLANDNGAQDDDAERNFFYRYLDAAGAPNETESPVLVSQVRVDIPHRGSPREWFANDLFGVLDLNLDADISPQPQSLYDAMDTLFYPDLALSAEDENAARLASITGAAGVITIRLNKENGMPGYRINIPEVFYLDRYSSDRIDVTEEIWWKTLEVYKSLVENKKLEDEAKKWRTSDGQSLDRKAVVDRQIKVLQERITMIQNCGRWRRHQDLNSKEAYFGEFRPESSSSPEETELIEQCEARIRQLEEVKAKTEKRLEKISSQMNKLEEECIKWRKILTEPSEEDKYNPTLPYTLVGVSSKVDVVFLRTDDPTQEKKWRRLACEGPNYLVKTKWVTFSEMMDEAACDKSCAPLLVYATEAALKEETEPLPPTFKNFIKTDNKSLRKDIDSTQPGLKRSGDPTTDSEAVRTKRSNSMDSVNVETDETADDPKGDPVETELMPPGSYKNPNNDTVHDNPEIEMQERPRTPLILQTLGNYDGGILLKGEQPNGVVADKDVEMSDIKDQEKN